MNAVSLFSSAGIAESYLSGLGINFLVANELLPKRAKLYQHLYPKTKMIVGNILEDIVFNKIVSNTPSKINFLLASPPCQGISIAGKNRDMKSMLMDERNYLFYRIVDFVKIKKPDYILIENVPTLLKLKLPYSNSIISIVDILQNEFGNLYNIESAVIDTSDFGVPQIRKRVIVKIYKKGIIWGWPKRNSLKVTVKDAIGHLPSLEAGECSDIKWHFARGHVERHITWMKHTPTGESAFNNIKHFPVKKDGSRINGYESTYRRLRWNAPAPTITIRNDAISSQRNVHPGRRQADGTYSDARVLTPLELFILTSLPTDWNIPDDTPEILIRQCIGESIPPKLVKELLISV